MKNSEEVGLIISNVQETIFKMKQFFDSHDFIRQFIWDCPKVYGNLLIKHGNVTTAHAEISNFLKNYASSLGIIENGDNESEDLFKNIKPCAQWEKMK